MEMVSLKSGMRIDRFDRFGEALRVIREGRGDIEAEVFDLLQKLSGILPILRRHFVRYSKIRSCSSFTTITQWSVPSG